MREEDRSPCVIKIYRFYPFERNNYLIAVRNHNFCLIRKDTFTDFARSFHMIDCATQKTVPITQMLYRDNPHLAFGGGIFYCKN
jgi:hypothetical protein